MAKKDCLYVHKDNSWWNATISGLDTDDVSVQILSTFSEKDTLNQNVLSVTEIFSPAFIVLLGEGNSFRIVHVDKKMFIDLSAMQKSDLIIFSKSLMG